VSEVIGWLGKRLTEYFACKIKCNRAQGLHVKEEWIQLQLQRRRSVASERERGVVTQEIFRSAMFLDFHHIGQGCLPPNIDQLHNVYLKGPFIVQIDEMFNIAGTTEKRYSDGSGRMLKIFASDGCQNVRRSAAYLYSIAVSHINYSIVLYKCTLNSRWFASSTSKSLL
jgi:hypothetical protein